MDKGKVDSIKRITSDLQKIERMILSLIPDENQLSQEDTETQDAVSNLSRVVAMLSLLPPFSHQIAVRTIPPTITPIDNQGYSRIKVICPKCDQEVDIFIKLT